MNAQEYYEQRLDVEQQLKCVRWMYANLLELYRVKGITEAKLLKLYGDITMIDIELVTDLALGNGIKEDTQKEIEKLKKMFKRKLGTSARGVWD